MPFFLCFILALWGCFFCDTDIGYLEVSSTYEIRRDDAYTAGDTGIASRAGKIDAMISMPVGTAPLALKRGGATFPLCTVTIKKNRVVSVTLSMSNTNAIACKVVD